MTMVSEGRKEMILRLDCSKCDRRILKGRCEIWWGKCDVAGEAVWDGIDLSWKIEHSGNGHKSQKSKVWFQYPTNRKLWKRTFHFRSPGICYL